MGLTEEYTRAREWIESELTFEVDDEFNTFEVSALSVLFCLIMKDYDPVSSYLMFYLGLTFIKKCSWWTFIILLSFFKSV